MNPIRLQPMGLAEAAAHVASLVVLSWLISRVRAEEALAVVEDRCGGMGRVQRAVGRSVRRLRHEAARLGIETGAAAAGPGSAGPEDAR